MNLGQEEGAAEAGAGEPVFRAQGGSLYVVATPLGNLRDITLRALDILRTADVIAAEDTRVSAVLLRHYGIGSRLLSLHAHNEAARADVLLARLAEGRSVALISDAGTPAVSDPGARAVAAVRAAGFPVIPVPGPNAAIAAISAAGLDAEQFLFAGFLPSTRKAREAFLARIARLPCAIVVYEAPHRVLATIADLARLLDPARPLTIARELTKRFETIATIPLQEAAAWMAADPNRVRGEFVLIVDAAPRAADAALAPSVLDDTAERWLQALLAHLPPAQAARIAAEATGMPRDAIYSELIARRGRQDED